MTEHIFNRISEAFMENSAKTHLIPVIVMIVVLSTMTVWRRLASSVHGSSQHLLDVDISYATMPVVLAWRSWTFQHVHHTLRGSVRPFTDTGNDRGIFSIACRLGGTGSQHDSIEDIFRVNFNEIRQCLIALASRSSLRIVSIETYHSGDLQTLIGAR